VSPNDTRGEGGLAKVLRDIFFKILSYIHVFWTAFFEEKRLLFWKIKMSRHTGGGGGSMLVSPNDT
jgi:hypothetical protein